MNVKISLFVDALRAQASSEKFLVVVDGGYYRNSQLVKLQGTSSWGLFSHKWGITHSSSRLRDHLRRQGVKI